MPPVDSTTPKAESHVLMRRLLPVVLILALAAPAHADDTDVPQGVGLTKKDQKEVKKKPRKPAWQAEGATVGKALVAVMVAAGSGWITGKAYKDNPLTERSGDGPGVGKGMHDSGTAARWFAGYVLPRGWLLGGTARLGLSRGHIDGLDDDYDAWLVGFRAGRIFYSNNSLDIFWYAGLGYGHMRHRVSNVPDPREEPDEFLRTDLWPFAERDKVDIYKKSGYVDINLGALIVYHFTPVFSLVFEINGDFLAPDVAFNIDVAGGLGIAFP
jgi:hypothetical protein